MKPQLEKARATALQLSRLLMDFLKSNTARLGLSYLAIIMVLSIGFSTVLYHTGAAELDRQLPPRSFFSTDNRAGVDPFGYRKYLNDRITEAHHELLARLVLLNLVALVAGGVISYILARRTLEPIEQALEAQARFASDASHELRTPLAVIQTENEVALRNTGLTLARAKAILASNLEEATRLRDLADGLLRLAREDKALELQPLAVPALATDAINHVLKIAQTKQITIEDKTQKLQVLGESQSLVQALVILFDNALKYSPSGSTIYLESVRKGKTVSLSVRDEGPGIAAEHVPYIFDRFYRADVSRSKQHATGHGLGLSIAKQIVEQQQGTLSVVSPAKQGATFTIKLPAA